MNSGEWIELGKPVGSYIFGDCNDGMKEFPDNYFGIAIVDPPYFKGINCKGYYGGANNLAKIKDYEKIDAWEIPGKDYFDELFRISKNQIVWGVNYFDYNFPPGRTVWVKGSKDVPFSSCEIAFNSFNPKKVNHFSYLWNGFWQEDMKNKEVRIHKTQKPVYLYRWILKKYATKGDIILDTHTGSASSLIAFEREGFEYVAFEKDKVCYDNSCKRLSDSRKILRLEGI